VVQLGTFNTVDVGGRAAHRQEHGVHGRVVGHRRPAVRGAAHVGLASFRRLLVLRVARVERPAHLAGDHVETTDHAARHVGLDVVGYTAAHYYGSTGHQRCRGQLVVGVRHVAQAGFQVDLTVVAEVLAVLAGVGVNCDQAGVDGVGQQATLAHGTWGHRNGGGWSAAIGRRGDSGGGVEVRQATAALPDLALGVVVTLPQLFAGVGVQGDDVVVRGADEHLVANLQRGVLVFGTVAVADGHVTGVVGPHGYQLGNVAAVDLVQRGEAATTFIVTVVFPVFLGVSRVNLGQAWAVAGRGHRVMRDEHAIGTGHHADSQQAAQRVATLATGQAIGLAQGRVDQCYHQAEDSQGEQARHLRPEHKAGIGDGPDDAGHHYNGEQPGTGQALLEQQDGGNQHADAGQYEVPATANGREVTTQPDVEKCKNQHAQTGDPCGPAADVCRSSSVSHVHDPTDA